MMVRTVGTRVWPADSAAPALVNYSAWPARADAGHWTVGFLG